MELANLLTGGLLMRHDIPFDLRYIPDFIFYTGFCKKAEAFPDDVEIQGTLALSPQIPVNMACLALIIDDYLVQFSVKGNVYILDIPNKSLRTRTLVDIVNAPNGSNWLMQVALASTTMIHAVDNDMSAFQRFSAFEAVLCHHTWGELNAHKLKSFDFIKNNVGLSNPNGLTMEYGAWEFEGHHVTWGRIANLLFKKYYADKFDWHK